MQKDHIPHIRTLLEDAGYPSIYQIIPLPSSGSNRKYFRIFFPDNHDPATLIASYNDDIRENIAYNSFTEHFKSIGFKVPEIYARDNSYCYFLIKDLGDTTLFSLLSNDSKKNIEHYKNVISDLLKFQVEGIKNLDLDVAYPVKKFNRRSIMWDLNYFKYYFVKPHNIDFDENLLENDFVTLAELLLSAENNYFCYRDFQSRNIMVFENNHWYIDFQGGRQGPLQYDLVSLLYQVKANLSDDEKYILYAHYIETLNQMLPGKQADFGKYYSDFIYFRLMQVMGAYGFRGLVQHKAHFLQSIPMAVNSISKLLKKSPTIANVPELTKVLTKIASLDYNFTHKQNDCLTVRINSFSFKLKGIPVDHTGNGGGHVFDCRALPNPGRIAELRDYTGLQKPVIKYLEAQEQVKEFLSHTIEIIDQSIINYQSRKFNDLQINFGCTGGRHRSVYSASKVAEYLQKKYPEILVEVQHMEID